MVSIKSGSRRKSRRAHFQAPSHVRRILMSAPLSDELRKRYDVRAMPVRVDDEVKIVKGKYKGKEGKVVKCYRLKWVIHVDKVAESKANGATVNVGIHPSNCCIQKLKLSGFRRQILERKNRSGQTEKKGKASAAEKQMQQMD